MQRRPVRRPVSQPPAIGPDGFVAIADPAALSDVLRRAIDSPRFRGRRSHAAKEVRLNPSQITRLLDQQHRRISSAVVEKLAKLVKLGAKEELPRFEAALIAPETQDVLVRHRQWVGARVRDWVKRQGARGVRDLTGAIRWIEEGESDAASRERARDVVELTAHIGRILGWDPLERLAEVVVRKALSEQLAMGRLIVAWHRVLEPILQSAESGFVELHWREMPGPQLRAFVEAGVLREQLVLLEREDDMSRARTVALHGFQGWLQPVAVPSARVVAMIPKRDGREMRPRHQSGILRHAVSAALRATAESNGRPRDAVPGSGVASREERRKKRGARR